MNVEELLDSSFRSSSSGLEIYHRVLSREGERDGMGWVGVGGGGRGLHLSGVNVVQT